MARHIKSTGICAFACWMIVTLSPLAAQAAFEINGGFELPPPFNFSPGPAPDQIQLRPGWIARGHRDGNSLAQLQTLNNGTASEGLNYLNLHVQTFAGAGGGDAHFFLLSDPFNASSGDVLSFDYRGKTLIFFQPVFTEMRVNVWNGNHTAIVAAQNLANSANWSTVNYLFGSSGSFLLEFFVHADTAPIPGAGAASVSLDIDDVRLTPEPTTGLVWAAGLLMVLAHRRLLKSD